MGGSFLWVLLLLCMGFFWGQVVSQQQPEEQSESYKTVNSGGGVSRWLSSPSTSHEPGSNWDGKPSRKEEVYKRCPMEGTIQSKLPDGLFFSNGYWEQSPETPPILPYSPPPAADGDESGMSTQPDDPVHVASFRLLKNAGRASGNKEDTMWASLELVITAGMDTITRVSNNTSSRDGGIRMQPGYSSLTISLEGLMFMKQGEEEISLCMLGCRSLLPPAAADSSFSTTAATSTQDCNVMLHLQFPKKLSLTTSVIRAQITSLSDERDKHLYFHPVNVTALSNEIFTQSYEYTVGDVVAQVCNDPNSGSGKEASEAQEGLLAMEDRFSGPQFLQALQQLLQVQLDVEPSLNCSESKEFCDNLGPFGSGRFATPAANHQLKEQERSVSKAQVVFRNFRFSWMPDDAVTVTTDSSAAERNVSAVILASQQTLGRQSGMYRMWFDNRTLVAEGLWKDETKQVCMVACQADAVIANVSSECNIRICLEIAINLSLERRSLVLGTISSTRLQHNEPGSFNSLLISGAFHHMYFIFDVHNKLHYTFNHLEEANAFRGKFEPDAGRLTTTAMKVIASKYPALCGNKSEDYYALNDQLSKSSLLIPKSGQSKKNLILKIEVIAIEDHITLRYGRMDTMVVLATDESDLHGKKKETPQMSSLKVAAQIVITEGWGDVPLVEYAAEGWYEPKDGKMYMVGCRAVNANWTMLQDNKRFLKGRLDCDLTLLLEYPSTVARWLSPSTVKVSIKSKRNADDAFYFLETSYETFPIAYMQQRKDWFFRNNLEGALSAGTLSVMFICIVVQLVHIGRNHDSAPFISLGMLGVQAIGYMIPLITEAEALFARNQRQQLGFAADQWSQRIKFTTKLLTLLAFLLILRLMERVWKERVSQAQKAELNTTQKNSPPPPQESNVILVCGIVHLVSFLLILAVHTIKSHASESSGTTKLIRWNRRPITMQKEAKEYWGLVEDLFLFPQVVGNAIWEVKGKPLHPMYYIGITILRLLPHLYDRLRRPLLSPFDVNFAYANPDADFYTRNADIVIPLLAIVLVLLVYFQQKWKGWLVVPSRRLYSKLPVKNAETELVSTQIPGTTVFSEDPEDHDEEQ